MEAPGKEYLAPESSHFVSVASLRERLDWFHQLRWVAGTGVLVAGAVAAAAHWDPFLVRGYLAVGLALLALNLVYVLRNHHAPALRFRTELHLVKLEMALDLLALTVLLYLSGGVENPLLFLYVVHVIIASLLFKGWEIYLFAALALALFTFVVLGEHLGWWPHHHLPLAGTGPHRPAFLAAVLGAFWVVILLSAYVGAEIMRHNRAIKDELVARHQKLLAEDEAKVDFFRFVTHEVKSPVHTAQSAVEAALEREGLDPVARDLLQRAVGRLGQATEMIRDLAELSRRGVVRPDEFGEFDLSDVVRTAVERRLDVARQRGQRLGYELPEHTVSLVSCARMVETIVNNLVDNAVRYNRDGGEVKVRLVEGPRLVRVTVEDQGIGIDPADQPRIFDEFFRSRRAKERSQLGSGLGLSIVKKFVESLGGSIELHSEPDVGSTFVVSLPRVR